MIMMKAVSHVLSMIFPLVLLALAGLLFHVYNTVWLKSQRIRKKLREQGIKGPSPSFLYGSLPEMQKIQSQATTSNPPNHAEIVAHDYTSTLFPYFEQWRKEYGTYVRLIFVSFPLSIASYLSFRIHFCLL
jgi:hypothetical protein